MLYGVGLRVCEMTANQAVLMLNVEDCLLVVDTVICSEKYHVPIKTL